MKKRIAALLLAALLGLTACGAPAETGAPTGEVFIYGEEHANAACLDKELALWQTCYGQGMRHLFIEMGAGSTLLLNRWMAAEDDAYWDMVYGACEGTLFHAEVVADFYHQIKETCPDTVFHGFDIEHQYAASGEKALRLLEDEVAEELSKREGDDRHRHVTIATGKAAAPSLEKHMQKIREKYPNVQAEVVTIINYFFGESITVSGLITGKDLMEQLEGRDLGDCLLLPCNMLRSGKNVFLDDVTVEEVEERLKTPVQIIDEPGSDLVKAVVEENQETIHRRRTMYEQADCSNCGTT